MITPSFFLTRERRISTALIALLAFAASSVFAQNTAFVYHGNLTQQGKPVFGDQDLRFGLFDTPTNGTAIATQTKNDVHVVFGSFTVTLDFGNAFDGNPRWLEISVKNKSGQFITMKPRQKFMPTPMAIMAYSASNLLGTLPASQLSGTLPPALLGGAFPSLVIFSNPANQFAGSGAGLSAVDATTLNGMNASNFWQLGGNGGTFVGTHFLGTKDNQPLDFRANNQRALRLSMGTNGLPNVLGGSSLNSITPGLGGITIGGGGGFMGIEANSVSSQLASIGGGSGNRIGAMISTFCTISGGHSNEIFGNSFDGPDFGTNSAIGGGLGNQILAESSVIGGGERNRIGSAQIGTTRGGTGHTITGGTGNRINYDNVYGAVGGGIGNFVDGSYACISGGRSNLIQWVGTSRGNTIAGGLRNVIASPDASTISGGGDNRISAFGYSAISGGQGNFVGAEYSVIPGGLSNRITARHSFAAGHQAQALNVGSFVWADSNDVEFTSTTEDEFSVRATGGARFVSGISNKGVPTSGVELPAGGGAWSSLSDRAAKENLSPVDSREILERVSQMPISTWNYKSQDSSIRHIGPMAQDFASAFAVGESERRITTVDADGVALAAIQGLHQIVREKDAEIQQLKLRLEKLEQLINQKAGGDK